MLTTIKGYYEHGQIVLDEEPPVTEKTEVIVTFLTEPTETNAVTKRVPGALKGKVTIPDNLNDPIDDLKEYM